VRLCLSVVYLTRRSEVELWTVTPSRQTSATEGCRFGGAFHRKHVARFGDDGNAGVGEQPRDAGLNLGPEGGGTLAPDEQRRQAGV
jgi:hypothetical protein